MESITCGFGSLVPTDYIFKRSHYICVGLYNPTAATEDVLGAHTGGEIQRPMKS